jgi:hypothetical protein
VCNRCQPLCHPSDKPWAWPEDTAVSEASRAENPGSATSQQRRASGVGPAFSGVGVCGTVGPRDKPEDDTSGRR